jgi:hypothetical protein
MRERAESNDMHDQFAANDLPFDLTPFADCVSLLSLVGISRTWRQCVVKQMATFGPQMWLQSHRSKLEVDALELCRLSLLSTWYDMQHVSVALIVDGHQNPLLSALDSLSNLPLDNRLCLRLPELSTRFDLIESESKYAAMTAKGRFIRDGSYIRLRDNADDIEDCWIVNGGEQVDHVGEAYALKELQRQWTAAYMSADGEDWNASSQQLCADTLACWHALCCCVMCDNQDKNGLRMRRNSAIFKHSSLRGTEWWKADMFTVGKWLPASQLARQDPGDRNGYPSQLAEELDYGSRPLTAVCLKYWLSSK